MSLVNKFYRNYMENFSGMRKNYFIIQATTLFSFMKYWHNCRQKRVGCMTVSQRPLNKGALLLSHYDEGWTAKSAPTHIEDFLPAENRPSLSIHPI